MKHLCVLGPWILATALAVLWLWFNPPSTECGGGAECDAGFDPFSSAKPDPRRSTTDVLQAVPLQVEYGRCAMTMRRPHGDPECIYEPGSELRLWVAHPRAEEAKVEIDGNPWPASRYNEADEPGQGLIVEIPGGHARRLSVRVPGEEPWALALRATTRLTTEEQAAVTRFKERGAVLEAYLTDGHLEVLPSIYEQIEQMFDRGLLSRGVEAVLVTAYHLTQLRGSHRDPHRGPLRDPPTRPLDAALELIDGLPPLDRFPRERAAASIYRGNVLLEQGRLVDAAVAYREGGRYAVRMDDPGLQIDALATYAKVLAELGYFEAAAYWGQRVFPLVRRRGRVVDQVNVLIAVGQANLRLSEAGQLHGEPGRWFREALGFLGHEDPMVDVGELDPARLGLARLAVLDGQPAAGVRWLDEVDPGGLTSDQLVELHDIRLQALLAMEADDFTRILEALDELDAAARRAVSLDAQWRAMVRRGVVLERAGQQAGARSAYEDAEALLDRLLPLARLGVATAVGPVGHTEGTQRLVSILLEQGHPARALCVARQAQARRGRLALLFRSLSPRARERLRPMVRDPLVAKNAYEGLLHGRDDLLGSELSRAHDEVQRRRHRLEQHALQILTTSSPGVSETSSGCGALGPRDPGELLLALYPHLGELLVFAQDEEGITYRVLSNPGDAKTKDMGWLGGLLLDPIDERLQRARRIRVLTVGRSAALPIHALTWRGRPLGVQVPVVYGLELPPPAPTPPTGSDPRALVLEDPRAADTDLETDAIAQMLQEAGWVVRHERSTDRPARVLREELAAVELFHYAGHAHYDAEEPDRWWPPYPGGAAARPSHILLGRVGRLEVQDVLMMEQVPRAVVLMGCDTGVVDERMAHGGLSLAAGFVAAGATAVVASIREVEGTEASLVGRGMHAQLAEGVVGDPGVWFMNGLRWAQRRGLSERALGDYRVFVP